MDGTIRNTQSKSGILIAGQQVDSQQRPRWGKVVGVGKEVDEEIKVGTYVLIEALMWTRGFTFDTDEKYWKTIEEKIIAVSDDEIVET